MWDYEKKIQMWYRFGVRVYYTKTQKYITEEMIRKEDTEECEIWKKHGQKEIELGKICVHCSFMISWIFYGMFSRKYEWMFIQKKDGRMICIHVSCTRTSNYSGKICRNYSRKYEEKMKERSREGGRYWWMICIQVSWNQDLTRAEAAVQCQQVTTCQYPSIGVIFDDGRQR